MCFAPSGECVAILGARHVDVGENKIDLRAAVNDGEGFGHIRCLAYLKARAAEMFGGRPPGIDVILNEEDRRLELSVRLPRGRNSRFQGDDPMK